MSKFFTLICISLFSQSHMYSSEQLIVPGSSYYTIEDQDNSDSEYRVANYYTATGDFIVKAHALINKEFEKLDPKADKPQPTTFAIRYFPQKNLQLYNGYLYRVVFFDKHGNKINPNLHPRMPCALVDENEIIQHTKFCECGELSKPSYWRKHRWLNEQKVFYTEDSKEKFEYCYDTLRIEGLDLSKALDVPLENTYHGVLHGLMMDALNGQGMVDIWMVKENFIAPNNISIENFLFDVYMVEDYFNVFDQIIDTAENSLTIPKFCINNLNHPLCKEYYTCLCNWIIADGLNNRLKENKNLMDLAKQCAQHLRTIITKMKDEIALLKFDVELEFAETLKLFGSLKKTKPSRTIRHTSNK